MKHVILEIYTKGGITMPNYNQDEQPAKLSAFIKPKRLAYGPEQLQFGDLYVPNQPGSYPVVILIHGGYWRARGTGLTS